MENNNKGELAKAIIQVMKAVKHIDKNMTVGEGKNSYQGTADEDVKEAIGAAMEEAGLVLMPIGVDDTIRVDRWEETNQYGTKMKQSIFTTVKTKYLLLHTSGESQVIEGYGHGVDSQDKSAGKATTYALKNTLLYTFLVPTKKIDDTDKTNSTDHPVPETSPATPKKAWLNPNTTQWTDAITYLKGNGTIAKIKLKYNISKPNEDLLKNAIL